MTLALMAHHECVQLAVSSGAIQWLMMLATLLAAWLGGQIRRRRNR